MKSAVENLSPTRVKLTVEVPSEELQPHVDAALKSIGSQIQVPGFRAGKVPARIIEQRVGKGAVIQEAVNEALPEFFGKAVDETGVEPIGQPEVDITEVPMTDGEELKFTVEVDVRPEVTLPDYDGVEISVDNLEVTDEDVEAKLTELRERFGTLVGVDRPAATGDFVSIDLKATIDGEDVDAVEGVSYEIGSGNMLEGLDDALVGMSTGETKDFSAPLAGGDKAGQSADCTVTVQSVKERELPEVDDDFAQMASEFDTAEELRADLAKQAEQSKKFEQGIQARDKVLDHLLSNTEIPLPEGIIEAEVNQHLEQEGRLEDDEHRAEVDESTRSTLKTQFLLDALAKAEEIEVGQPELVEYLIMQSQQYGMDPNQFAQLLDQQGQVESMVSEVARRKALAAALDKAKIVDADGNAINLDDIVPEGERTGDVEELADDEAETVEAEGTDEQA
ncbi:MULTISPECIES: trigger factor [Janibacter]|uniref:Trigger factor n=1 Tax=Janibacter indicus TaxID=857417 RepID=A0A1W2CHD8_9MICO|nr:MULTISPECIES: trigger factor [Janibacter]QNF93218.1 trigger factor [Janibacter sp. YB324]SMC84476.1 trigger factor [Janibacter indicus]